MLAYVSGFLGTIRAAFGVARSSADSAHNVAVVADLDNVSISLGNNGIRPDWRALYGYATTRGRVVAAEAFAETRDTEGYQSFVAALERIGYNVHLSPSTGSAGWRKPAPVDHSLIARTMALLMDHKIHEVILATGDGDFLPLVSQLTSRGISVTVVFPDGSTSRRLTSAASEAFSFSRVGTTRLHATTQLNKRPAMASARAY